MKYCNSFLTHFVNYFFEHGVYTKELRKKGSYLYRGLDSDFMFTDQIIENGFMSTSYDITVAKEFAKSDGNIMTLKVKHLPKDMPYVVIDNNLVDYLYEREVLFLPGVLDINQSSYSATYKPNQQFINTFKMSSGGGSETSLDIDVPKINLKGKYVVWYRAITDRSCEVIGFKKLLSKDIDTFIRKVIYSIDSHYNNIARFIPEYMDLHKKKDKTKEETDKQGSYTIYMAIYDPRNANVDSINFEFPRQMFEEVFDISREQEVINTIKDSCAWLGKNS